MQCIISCFSWNAILFHKTLISCRYMWSQQLKGNCNCQYANQNFSNKLENLCIKTDFSSFYLFLLLTVYLINVCNLKFLYLTSCSTMSSLSLQITDEAFLAPFSSAVLAHWAATKIISDASSWRYLNNASLVAAAEAIAVKAIDWHAHTYYKKDGTIYVLVKNIPHM